MEKVCRIAKPRVRRRNLGSIVGKSFGLLEVLEERRIKEGIGKSLFQVKIKCVCGVTKWVEERSVRRGLVKSCGRCASKTHGASKSNEYAVWRAMLDRCNNPNHKAYVNYGGRGVTVCDEWLVFENFIRDMGTQPFKGASIDRTNNNAGYSKKNCQWVNRATQNRNKRSNRLLTINAETQPICVWSERSGVRHNTICYRLDHGWDPKAAVFTKPNFANRYGDC